MLSVNDKIGHLPLDLRDAPVQVPRGWVTGGLRYRPIGRWTYQVTGGTEGSSNTHDLLADGVSILTAPVAQGSSNANTATAIATAVNANSAASGFYATVASDTVTVRQRRSGARTVTRVVDGDATGTLTAAFASTNTWTHHVSGATFDGDEYYELSWSGELASDAPGGLDLSRAALVQVALRSAQALQLWSGPGVQVTANAIIQGDPVDADTWTDVLPWTDAATPLTVKLAADGALFYRAFYL